MIPLFLIGFTESGSHMQAGAVRVRVQGDDIIILEVSTYVTLQCRSE